MLFESQLDLLGLRPKPLGNIAQFVPPAKPRRAVTFPATSDVGIHVETLV